MNESPIRGRRALVRALAGAGFATAAAAASAATIHVPADVSTIQAAIGTASPGDTVLVAPGTYHESIDFLGKDITVASEQGAAATIIDAGGLHPVVRFHSHETRAAVLRGFSLRNGNPALDDYPDGGGVQILYASPTVEYNDVSDSSACDGNGIDVAFSSALVRHNHVHDNHQNGCDGGTVGGGIEIGGHGHAEVSDNVVENNRTDMAGGGIGMNAAGKPIVTRNIIRNNVAGFSGGGVATMNDSKPYFADNVVYGNTAPQGGGLDIDVPYGSTGGTWINNTVADNLGQLAGSELYTGGFVQALNLGNNIFRTTRGPSGIYCDPTYTPISPIFTTNDLLATTGTVATGSCAGVFASGGNVSVDPLFASGNAAAPYKLSAHSPAIDAGTATTLAGTTDAAGKPRVADGNGDGSAVIDLGAYERQPR